MISAKLNIGKKMIGLEIMTLNSEKFSMFPNLQNWCLREAEGVGRVGGWGESYCLQEYFRKQRMFKFG